MPSPDSKYTLTHANLPTHFSILGAFDLDFATGVVIITLYYIHYFVLWLRSSCSRHWQHQLNNFSDLSRLLSPPGHKKVANVNSSHLPPQARPSFDSAASSSTTFSRWLYEEYPSDNPHPALIPSRPSPFPATASLIGASNISTTRESAVDIQPNVGGSARHPASSDPPEKNEGSAGKTEIQNLNNLAAPEAKGTDHRQTQMLAPQLDPRVPDQGGKV